MKQSVAKVWLFFVALVCFMVLIQVIPKIEMNSSVMLQNPSPQYFFGTDSLGRDYFLRVLQATPLSLFFGVVGSTLSLFFALIIAFSMTYTTKLIDSVLLRATDIMLAIPNVIIIAVICLSFQNSTIQYQSTVTDIFVILFTIAFTHALTACRTIRAIVLKEKVQGYVEAAKALGASDSRIFRMHILKNLYPELKNLWLMQIPISMLYESFLSYIGLGSKSSLGSWGTLLNEGWRSMAMAPHLILFPTVFIFLTILSLHSLANKTVTH